MPQRPSTSVDLRGTGEWPKTLPDLTEEQEQVRDRFMARWLEVLPHRFGVIERFNHTFGVPAQPNGRTLEIGAGLGAHIGYEDLKAQDYYAVELRPELAERLGARFPDVTAVVADCQRELPFEAGYFDRVIAVHVLEHLPDLPAALSEIRRVLSPTGTFVTVIPCEGGLAYAAARRVSAQRIFEREFGMPYEWLIRSEHINVPWEIELAIRREFEITRRRFFPLRVPLTWANLVIGIEATHGETGS